MFEFDNKFFLCPGDCIHPATATSTGSPQLWLYATFSAKDLTKNGTFRILSWKPSWPIGTLPSAMFTECSIAILCNSWFHLKDGRPFSARNLFVRSRARIPHLSESPFPAASALFFARVSSSIFLCKSAVVMILASYLLYLFFYYSL